MCDYKHHTLVYENATVLRRIIADRVMVIEVRKELNKKLEAVMEFLKYSYITHLDDGSGDPLHDTKYALKHGKSTSREMFSKCWENNCVLKFLDEVSDTHGEPSEQLKKILTGSAFKFEQLMEHKVRAKTQESRINELFN